MSGLRYLLISPGELRTIAQNSNNKIETIAAFPVGLAYVSAAMKHAGFETFTINSSFIKTDIETALKSMILENNIDVVCTGGTILDVHGLMHIIRYIKELNPKIKTVVGGAIISSDPETSMNVLGADIGVIGEGEETMCELASTLNSGEFYGQVPGIIFRNNDTLERSSCRLEIADINNLTYMDFDGFAYSEWLATTDFSGIVHSARSCPFKCTFCFKSTGNKYRQRSLDSVFDEIDYQIEKYNIKSIMISDELFATNDKRIYDFCARIKPYNISWGSSLRVGQIEPDLLRLMKNSGCRGIGTGLESGHPEILKSMQKRMTVEQLEKALDIFVNSEMSMLGNFIFGDEGETKETVKTTVDLWKRYNQKLYINLGIVATFPGTKIYENACERGVITDKEQFLRDGKFIINISKMNDSEYYDMISHITELGYLTQVPAKSVNIVDVNSESICEVKWLCRQCNKEHTQKNVHFLQAPIITCSCGIQNTIEPFRDVSHNNVELKSALPENEVIAFWGVGSQFYRMSRFYEGFDSDRFIQIDADEHHQKMTRLGKKIYSPEIINQKEIKTVIITSPIAKDAIIRAIDQSFPSITKVFFPNLLKINGELVPTFELIKSKHLINEYE